MMTADPAEDRVTALLVQASGGNVEALNQLFPLVYDELRRLARGRLRRERGGHTLNTTALVHEAYIRLVGQHSVEWRGRSHFYAIASRAMQRILVNYAEARRARKRGGAAAHVPLDEAGVMLDRAGLALDDSQLDEILAVDEALDRLRTFNERGADIVTYRFFGGLTHEEIADIMGTSEVTVRRAWTASKSWLRRELRLALDRAAPPLRDSAPAPVPPDTMPPDTMPPDTMRPEIMPPGGASS